MRDELYDRDYQAGRDLLHDGIDRLLARMGGFIVRTIDTLHRIQWSAPWDGPATR